MLNQSLALAPLLFLLTILNRADGTVKRGRGRGRGGTTRGTAAARGPTIRKPRLTKKEKERMEKEKEEREKTFFQATSTKPPGGG